jgi:hypothetical protein
LKESFNYGLFCPPSNGKAGKFLDEERRLGDYPFSGPVGYLEVSSSISIFDNSFVIQEMKRSELERETKASF